METKCAAELSTNATMSDTLPTIDIICPVSKSEAVLIPDNSQPSKLYCNSFLAIKYTFDRLFTLKI